MAAAERVVADGGTIMLAAACVDGIPDGGAFARLLAGADGASDPGPSRGTLRELDRWQAQVLGRVLERAEVWLHTAGLGDDEVRRRLMTPVDDVDAGRSPGPADRPRAAGPGSASCPTARSPWPLPGDRPDRPVGRSGRGSRPHTPHLMSGARPHAGDRVAVRWPTRCSSTSRSPTSCCRRSWPERSRRGGRRPVG